MSRDKAAVQTVLDKVRNDGRNSLTAPEGKTVCEAYGIPTPKEGLATTAAEAGKIAENLGFPVVLKVVSPDILHKPDAGGVLTGVAGVKDAEQGFESIMKSARAHQADAKIVGIQVQRMLPAAQEVIIGAVIALAVVIDTWRRRIR